MTQIEILQALKHMTNAERLTIAETALRLIREDLQQQFPTPAQLEQELAAAAEALREDYAPGGELTVFTTLDGEDFYEYTDENLTDIFSHA